MIFFAVLGLCVCVCVDGGNILAMGHVSSLVTCSAGDGSWVHSCISVCEYEIKYTLC